MARGLPRLKTLLPILALFVWYGSGVEDSKYIKQVASNPRVLLTNPLLALVAMVDRSGDDRLYFNYAQLMLGHSADLDYLARKEQGDPAAALARLRSAITPDGHARLPYRDFPVEYPPVPLLLMLLPRLLMDGYGPYRIVFSALMAALFLLSAWLAALTCKTAEVPGTPSTETVWRRLGWLLFATGPIICQRFDMLPAALVAATLAALVHRRDRLAGIAVGLGIMTKLYPLLLCVPLAAFFLGANQRRRVLVIAGAASITVALIVVPFLIAAPEAFLRSNALYGARPFHFESTWGSALLATHGPATVVGSFGSKNVISPAWLLRLSSLVLFSGLLAIAVCAWKKGRTMATSAGSRQVSACLPWALATLLFILITSKVLSPQFMIWLLPLAVVLPGATGRRLFLGTFGLMAATQIFYPALYDLALAGRVVPIAVLLTRNVILIGLAVSALRIAARQAQPASAVLGSGSERDREIAGGAYDFG
jgi:uncharacterized membrane protein